MKILVRDKNEPLTADIEMYVRAGRIQYRIKFLTESQLAVKSMRESVEKDDWIDTA